MCVRYGGVQRCSCSTIFRATRHLADSKFAQLHGGTRWALGTVPNRLKERVITRRLAELEITMQNEGAGQGGVGPIRYTSSQTFGYHSGTVRQLNASGAQDLRAIQSLDSIRVPFATTSDAEAAPSLSTPYSLKGIYCGSSATTYSRADGSRGDCAQRG